MVKERTMFIRKHYKKIAQVLHDCYVGKTNITRELDIINAITMMLRQDNDKFDEQKFLDAVFKGENDGKDWPVAG